MGLRCCKLQLHGSCTLSPSDVCHACPHAPPPLPALVVLWRHVEQTHYTQLANTALPNPTPDCQDNPTNSTHDPDCQADSTRTIPSTERTHACCVRPHMPSPPPPPPPPKRRPVARLAHTSVAPSLPSVFPRSHAVSPPAQRFFPVRTLFHPLPSVFSPFARCFPSRAARCRPAPPPPPPPPPHVRPFCPSLVQASVPPRPLSMPCAACERRAGAPTPTHTHTHLPPVSLQALQLNPTPVLTLQLLSSCESHPLPPPTTNPLSHPLLPLVPPTLSAHPSLASLPAARCLCLPCPLLPSLASCALACPSP